MKITLTTTTLTLLLTPTLTFGLALPNIRPSNTYPLSTLQLSNDLSGANAVRSLPANGVPVTFLTLFAGTALIRQEEDGELGLKATSLQNVAPGSRVRCVVRTAGGEVVVGVLDEETTWVDLDGDSERSVETDVGGWTVGCE